MAEHKDVKQDGVIGRLLGGCSILCKGVQWQRPQERQGSSDPGLTIN